MSSWEDELNRIRTEVEGLAELPKKVARKAAKTIEQLIDQQFEDSVDPYGNAWEDLTDETWYRKQGDAILVETGAMRDSLKVQANGSDIVASLDDPFPYHQMGTSNMPARPVLPVDDEVPETWQETIDDAVEEELNNTSTFRGTRVRR